jgi:hypothetical protein
VFEILVQIKGVQVDFFLGRYIRGAIEEAEARENGVE